MQKFRLLINILNGRLSIGFLNKRLINKEIRHN